MYVHIHKLQNLSAHIEGDNKYFSTLAPQFFLCEKRILMISIEYAFTATSKDFAAGKTESC